MRVDSSGQRSSDELGFGVLGLKERMGWIRV